jgi:hypothetical protein
MFKAKVTYTNGDTALSEALPLSGVLEIIKSYGDLKQWPRVLKIEAVSA